MKIQFSLFFLILFFFTASAQPEGQTLPKPEEGFMKVSMGGDKVYTDPDKDNGANDAEAAALLQKVSGKYKAYKNIAAKFQLLVQRPKVQPTDDEKKLTDTLTGSITIQGAKFKVSLKGQDVWCDGKNVWTLNARDKETELSAYQESDDMFSPSKIFTLYKDGYLYQIKEKKTVAGHKLVVIEMTPPNKKLSWFKIDITIDQTSMQLVESMIYQKNGTHFIYKLLKQTPDSPTTDATFTYEPKKHPGIKVVDLR